MGLKHRDTESTEKGEESQEERRGEEMQKEKRGDGRAERKAGGCSKGSVFVPFRAGRVSTEADGCVCEAATRGRSRKRKSSDRLRHDTEPLRD